ncbi:tlde1 domain-containing protein [Paraburkholderia ferrariae]|uniref:tlde1 domain-containing protein n=1 Tax=Paraburkholderia ferrariae TaxID=386056 RepID=UPI0009FBA908|nr:tlde1 domain-containing protein [Paraburkholderia ferrariae]
MPWVYKQSNGELSHNGRIVKQGNSGGYSGSGAGKNNPAMQATRSIGPIPQGTYNIGTPRHSAHVGRYAMPLTPEVGTDTFGRSAFYMHGDSVAHPGSASEGCIIMDPHTRSQVWTSGDRKLQVIQ